MQTVLDSGAKIVVPPVAERAARGRLEHREAQ